MADCNFGLMETDEDVKNINITDVSYCNLTPMEGPQSNGHEITDNEGFTEMLVNYEPYDGVQRCDEIQIIMSFIQDDNSPYNGHWNKLVEIYDKVNQSEAVKNEIIKFSNELNENVVFNMTFRSMFSFYLEHIRWDDIDETEGDVMNFNYQLALEIVKQLIELVQRKIDECNVGQSNDLGYVSQLHHWKQQLKTTYYRNPMEMVRIIKRTLKAEMQIFQLAKNEENPPTPSAVSMFYAGATSPPPATQQQNNFSSIVDINKVLGALEQEYLAMEKKGEYLKSQFNHLQFATQQNIGILDTYCNIDGFDVKAQVNLNKLRADRHNAMNLKTELGLHIKDMLKKCEELLPRILMQIQFWQRVQAYENNGRKIEDVCSIDNLEKWCRRLAVLLENNFKFAYSLIAMELLDPRDCREHNKSIFNSYLQSFQKLLCTLISKSLVIENHPPQVLMKDKNFSCQLRHLVADGLDIHKDQFTCNVNLVSEKVAERLHKDNTMEIEKCADILLSSVRSEFQEQSRQLQIRMRKMSLKMKQRARNNEVVAEEKCALVFRANIFTRFGTMRHAGNHMLYETAQVMSLPIVVTSHGKQDPDAQATIFWDNAFSKLDRVPFEVQKNVPWLKMLKELDFRWKKDCELGLSEQAKEFLTSKLFNHTNINANPNVNWKEFNKDPLRNYGSDIKNDFTFWKWFFRIMELVKHKLVIDYWKKGLIKGFLSKKTCYDMLMADDIKVGTFLFRFSETQLGCVSISCKEKFANGKIDVNHYVPDNIKALETRSLGDIVLDLGVIKYLYPDIPKEVAFGGFTTTPEDSDDSGYVQKVLRASVIRR